MKIEDLETANKIKTKINSFEKIIDHLKDSYKDSRNDYRNIREALNCMDSEDKYFLIDVLSNKITSLKEEFDKI